MKTLAIAATLSLSAVVALPAAAQVNARQATQQERIDRGVRSGQLTPGEARHLERQQGRIARTEAHMRDRNGGYLTPRQRARLHARQNRASANIFRKKHNFHMN